MVDFRRGYNASQGSDAFTDRWQYTVTNIHKSTRNLTVCLYLLKIGVI